MKKTLFYILLILFSILFFWSNTLINLNTHLINWDDEAFIIWVFQNNIEHFLNLDFKNLYETNGMYPLKYSLLFSDSFFTQSIIVMFLRLFTKNIIAQFNLLLIINHILIFLSSLLFFRQIFKKKIEPAILSSFFLTYSPFYFTQIGHLHIIFFWPIFFSLYFLVKFFDNRSQKFLFLSAIFIGIQILSSLYLGLMSFLINFLFIFILAKVSFIKKMKYYLTIVVISIFLAIPSILGYYLVNQAYHFKREYTEFLVYSAHLSDYLFPHPKHESILYTASIFQKLNKFNYHLVGESAAFLGLGPIILSIFYLLPKIKKTAQKTYVHWNIIFELDKLSLVAILIILMGFTFSLGPRLWVNGQYTHIPLPYNFLLKIFPPLEIIRAVARWHFLVVLGISIILGLGFLRVERKMPKKRYLVRFPPLIALVFFFIEFWSKPFPVFKEEWMNPAYEFLSNNICKNSTGVLLEYPLTYRNWDGDLKKNLRYRSLILLASTQHKCRILSGYTGFEPQPYVEIKKEFDDGFSLKDIELIKRLSINYIKFNLNAITKEEKYFIEKNNLFNEFKNIYEDENTVILKVLNNS